MPELVVRALPLNDTWKPIGTDRRRGIFVEDFQCSSDPWGPLDCSFLLKRSPRVRWPDLDAWSNLEIELDNNLVWSGRVIGTPGSDGDAEQVQVVGQGWQSHLDDRPFSRLFVTNDLGRWTDIRSNQNANLAAMQAATQVSNDETGITLTLPLNSTRALSTGGGVMIDLGPNNTSARVVVSWTHSANSAGSGLFLYASNTIAGLTSPSAVGNIVTSMVGTASGTSAFTIGPYRYLLLVMADVINTALTPGADVWAKFTAVQVFTSTAYESGNASILKASDVVTYALSRLIDINGSAALIGATSFSIPAFTIDRQTPRDAINAANAWQDWQPRVTAERYLEYRAKPTAPTYALTDLAAFDDASSGSVEQVFNEVAYVGTGPDGTPVAVTRIASAAGLPASIPDRRGGFKAFTIQSDAPLTAAAAQQLCDVFLSQHNTMPFKGTIHATSPRSVQIIPSGANCPPWQLLRAPGELVNFKHLQNPDTGTLGRDGRIAKATYTHATNSTELDIDSTSGSYDALSARLAVVTAR